MQPLIPFTVEIFAHLTGMDWQVAVRWRLWGRIPVLRRTWTGSLIEIIPDKHHSSIMSLRFYRYAPWAALVLPIYRGHWRKVSAFIRLGTGDAARTARCIALVWALNGLVLHGLSRRHGHLDQPAGITIQPVFQHRLLQISADCIVTSGIRDIMAVLLWVGLARIGVYFHTKIRKERSHG